MRVKKLLQKVDMLGPGFSLNVGGSETLKSTPGSILTLCYFLSMVGATVYFITKFFDRSSPTINEHSEYDKAGKTVPIGNLSYFPIFFVRDSFSVPIKVERALLAINPYLTNFQRDAQGVRSTKVYKSISCREVRSDSSLLDYFSDSDDFKLYENLIIERGICIAIPKKDQSSIESLPPNEQQIQLNDSSKYSTLNYEIFPCDLLIHQECLSSHYFGELDPLATVPPDFDGGLATIEVLFPKYGYDPTNYNKPYSKYFDLENSFSIRAFYTVRSETEIPLQTTLYDESQYFGSDRLTYSLISTTSKSFELRNREVNSTMKPILDCKGDNSDPEYYCDSFFALKFSSQQKEVKIIRKYEQIIDILSGIGGISSLLLQFFTYANLGVLFFTQKNILTSKLLPMLPQKKLKIGKKKNQYPDIKVDNENDEKEVQEHNKYWDGVIEDAVDLVERTIDITFLFKELSKVRVLANALLDESQTELSPISSLMMYRKEKEKEEGEKEKDKKNPSGTNFNSDDNNLLVKNKTRNTTIFISERKKEAIRKRQHIKKIEKRIEGKNFADRLQNPTFEDKVDLHLIDSIKELKLEGFSYGSRLFLSPSKLIQNRSFFISSSKENAGNIKSSDLKKSQTNYPLGIDPPHLKSRKSSKYIIQNENENLFSLNIDEEIHINPIVNDFIQHHNH